LLADAGLSGTFFVLAGRLDQPGSLSRAQIREMAAAGMTIGSHGHDHVRWTEADDPTMRRELRDARAKIEDCLGMAVTELSIPFGAFDRRVMRLVVEAGYRHVHTSAKAMASPASWFLPRYTIAQWTEVDREIPAWTSLPSRLRSGVRNELRARRFGFSTSTAGPGR
jgi:peptidoglycan/xylan/chitin deacetylase (PgdA/CDA1 family)